MQLRPHLPDRDPHGPQADPRLAARGRLVHLEWSATQVARVVDGRRVLGARGPRPPRDCLCRSSHFVPHVARRDGRALRHAGRRALSEERLRHRRIRARQVGELARTRLRLPRVDSVLGRDGVLVSGRAADDQERDLHPRGRRWYSVETLRLPHRAHRSPPRAQARRLVDQHRRQLRVRALLLLLPRRHHRDRGQGDGHHQHVGLRPRAPVQVRRRSLARRPGPHPPAHLLRQTRLGRRRRREPRHRVRHARRTRGGVLEEPLRQRVLRPGDGPRDRRRPARRSSQGALLEVRVLRQEEPRRQADGLQARTDARRPALRPAVRAVGQARGLRAAPPVGHALRRGRALSGGRIHEPRRRHLRRPAQVRRAAPLGRGRRPRRVVLLRAAPPAAPRGLPRAALHQGGLQAHALGLLRPQPLPRPPLRRRPHPLDARRRRGCVVVVVVVLQWRLLRRRRVGPSSECLGLLISCLLLCTLPRLRWTTQPPFLPCCGHSGCSRFRRSRWHMP
mmetsp:Transcript_6670/g.27974  ORF Transcript_6670/g.27974 Transcript_6670/m.27974 type:complete len:506 (+) Transcript_6670:823-2340(+)